MKKSSAYLYVYIRAFGFLLGLFFCIRVCTECIGFWVFLFYWYLCDKQNSIDILHLEAILTDPTGFSDLRTNRALTRCFLC
jgi:hypothetical protein